MRSTMLLQPDPDREANILADENLFAQLASFNRKRPESAVRLAAGSCTASPCVRFCAGRSRIPALVKRQAAMLARSWAALVRLCSAVAFAVATTASRVVHGLRDEADDLCRLGPYTLIEKLGEGGMGKVYRASHAMLERPTAVKVLPPDRFGPESLARFEREVQQTARLTHHNTIRIFDYGQTADGIFYYAMEYLDGGNLADVVAESGPLPPSRVIHVLDQIAGALAEAHRAGLIHCDIKPANIFLTEQGGVSDVAKLLDFGLVKQVGGGGAGAAAQPVSSRSDRITGTPLYMAPEAIAAPDEVDARTDLYALGAVGYFLLTGQDVFTGRTLLEVCGHHLHSSPVPPSLRLGARIPADLEQLILSCLEKDPRRRPADARALQTALRACRDARSWSDDDARRWFDTHAEALRARRAKASN